MSGIPNYNMLCSENMRDIVSSCNHKKNNNGDGGDGDGDATVSMYLDQRAITKSYIFIFFNDQLYGEQPRTGGSCGRIKKL